MVKIIHKELSYKITGLLFKAHKDLGRYRNEKQYADYFESLLKNNKLDYKREYKFDDFNYGQNKIRCVVDFIIENKIILEFKAKKFITSEDYYQVRRYLTTLNLELAVLVNFRSKALVPKRILNSDFLK